MNFWKFLGWAWLFKTFFGGRRHHDECVTGTRDYEPTRFGDWEDRYDDVSGRVDDLESRIDDADDLDSYLCGTDPYSGSCYDDICGDSDFLNDSSDYFDDSSCDYFDDY